MAKTDPIDPAVPQGDEDPKLGDNRIRELARAVIEFLSVDHYVGTNGGAGTGYNEDAAGEHAKVTIRNGSAPTKATGKGYLYVVSGELYYKDPSGNAIQLTTGGILNSANLTGNQTIAGVKTFSSQPSLAAGLTAAAAIISTLATGTAPLTIASTTKVTNLNADKWDGKDVSSYSGGESFIIPGTPNDVIIKMGYNSGGSNKTVTFADAFPNGIKFAIPVMVRSDLTSQTATISSPAKTGFTIYCGDALATGYYWFAIGY